MSIFWKEVQEHPVLHVDYRGIDNKQDMIALQAESFYEIAKHDDDVLLFVDLRGSFIYAEFFESAKRGGRKILSDKVKRGAILGIDQEKYMMFQEYVAVSGVHFRLFHTEEDAFAYLVS